jgi:hypothetical protein
MRERTRFQKRIFRYSLHKQKRSVDAVDRQLIQLALVDRTIFEMAYEQTMEELLRSPTAAFGFSVSRALDGSPVVDNLLKLLDWFVEHGPALIEIIQLIAQLFGGVASASSILREEIDTKSDVAGEEGGQ